MAVQYLMMGRSATLRGRVSAPPVELEVPFPGSTGGPPPPNEALTPDIDGRK